MSSSSHSSSSRRRSVDNPATTSPSSSSPSLSSSSPPRRMELSADVPSTSSLPPTPTSSGAVTPMSPAPLTTVAALPGGTGRPRGPYDSDSTSSDEAVVPTPEMADRAEKMRRRLTQRASNTATASSSQPSPAPRSTPPPPQNVVDLTPSPVVSPTRQPPPPQSESPSSKRPAEQTDAPAPKKIRLSHEVDEDAQIWQGNSSVRKWAANKLTFQMEMSRRLREYKTGLKSMAVRVHQTEEAFLEEQAKHAKVVGVHNSEMLRVTRQWEEERDKVATIAATSAEDYKKSASFEADVKAAIEARQKEIAKEWLATPEGDDFRLVLGERDYRLGFREAQTEIHSALLVRDSSFTP
ncbi:PREDICTED: vegetative cell wall protein gp1-like [Ipomoea nil]|uniref:vegetative cell wall protein gp1-like n=1 Tax=Ipomoea nil TaxID=35883 RepID=UPI0009014FB0|nr:PREDICTED: vegetative cell wall protein gp1-like [Ipomoea nil]